MNPHCFCHCLYRANAWFHRIPSDVTPAVSTRSCFSFAFGSDISIKHISVALALYQEASLCSKERFLQKSTSGQNAKSSWWGATHGPHMVVQPNLKALIFLTCSQLWSLFLVSLLTVLAAASLADLYNNENEITIHREHRHPCSWNRK